MTCQTFRLLQRQSAERLLQRQSAESPSTVRSPLSASTHSKKLDSFVLLEAVSGTEVRWTLKNTFFFFLFFHFVPVMAFLHFLRWCSQTVLLLKNFVCKKVNVLITLTIPSLHIFNQSRQQCYDIGVLHNLQIVSTFCEMFRISQKRFKWKHCLRLRTFVITGLIVYSKEMENSCLTRFCSCQLILAMHSVGFFHFLF